MDFDLNGEGHREGQKRAKGFVSGVLLLSASTLLVKIIGLAFKIPMLSYLGTEGMGYFNSAYEIYALLCTVSTAGLPVALSMLVSTAKARGNGREVKRVYRTALLVFLTFGICGSAVMMCFAKHISEIIGNPNAYPSIYAIAPALFFICVASAVRGYCQGFEIMAPTAVSQLIEALSKLGFGVLFASLALKKGLEIYIVSAYAVLGVTLGTVLSAFFLSIFKGVAKKRFSVPENIELSQKGVFGELFAIALPITLGSALLGMTRMMDMTLIMRRLQDAGMSVGEANKIYGAYTTLALPIFGLVPALITPVSMALVPQLASFIETGNNEGQRTVVKNSLKMTVLLSMPSSFGIAIFSRPVLELLFSNQREAIDISAPLLSMLGLSVVFSCLITTVNAILQSYRRAYLPIFSMLAGVVVKLIASYILIGVPSFGAMGAPLGSLLCNITVTLVNILFLSRIKACRIKLWKILSLPLVASVMALGGGFALYIYAERLTDNKYIPLVAAIAIAVPAYFLLCRLMGVIDENDIEMLPLGGAICKIKNKLTKKFIKNK